VPSSEFRTRLTSGVAVSISCSSFRAFFRALRSVSRSSLDAGVVAMLTRWRGDAEPKATDPVFTGITWSKLAPTYRDHCEAVGIDRVRLFQKKENKLRLRAHDTRAFFTTAGMFAGRDALWLTDRTGHTSLTMLRRYERDVRKRRELGETAPVAADQGIPELSAAANTAANAAAATDRRRRRDRPTGRKCTGRESNPYASRRRNLNPLRLPVSPPVQDAAS
jgi:hypothetical protein